MNNDNFHRVITQYAAPLARVAAGYAADVHQQQDLLQEIYFALWQALPNFRGEARELTFVLSVAHNRGLSFAAKASRKAFIALPEDAPDPKVDITIDVERRERAELLYSAIRRLAPSQRQAIMLQLEGLSGREIAVAQGTTEANVNVRLSRARAELRQVLAVLAEEE